jgi:hypothetical protein
LRVHRLRDISGLVGSITYSGRYTNTNKENNNERNKLYNRK